MNSFITPLVLASAMAVAQEGAIPQTILNSSSAITVPQETEKAESYVGWLGLLGLMGLVVLRRRKNTATHSASKTPHF